MTPIPSEEDMTNQEIQSLLEAQRAYYRSGLYEKLLHMFLR